MALWSEVTHGARVLVWFGISSPAGLALGRGGQKVPGVLPHLCLWPWFSAAGVAGCPSPAPGTEQSSQGAAEPWDTFWQRLMAGGDRMSPGRERWGGRSLSWCQPATPARPLVVPSGVVHALGLPGAVAQPGRPCPSCCWDAGTGHSTGTVPGGWCLGLGGWEATGHLTKHQGNPIQKCHLLLI